MAKRIILIVLDSAGAGALPDAFEYGDEGADTIGHVLETMGRDFFLPNLGKLGLGACRSAPDALDVFRAGRPGRSPRHGREAASPPP